RALVAAAALGLPVAAALACTSILGLEDLTLLDAAAGDATPEAQPREAGDDATDAEIDAADAGDAAPETGCVHAVPPGPPATDDTPDGGDGGSIVDFVAALDSIDFGLDQNNVFHASDPIGFDLDGVCTCFDGGGPSCTSKNANCDGPGGRDEAANMLLSNLGILNPHLSQASLLADLRSGQFGVLVHVLGYNGLANDQSVIVDFFASPGTTRDGKGNPIPPAFDGNDTWLVTSNSVLTGSKPNYVSRYEDGHAYVNDHVLVARLPAGFPLLIRPDTGGNSNPITLTLSPFELAAELALGDGGRWTLQNGVVGARWATSAALYDFHTLADPDGGSLCGSDLEYGFLANQVCGSPDIASDPADDDAGLPCSALSMGIGFSGSAAQLGDVFDPSIVGVDCPDGWAPQCP
ncbi:MAG TPA: hypothetical protein VE987_10870, partial [Polyangiaceae bacterium]|nr:hypothetical protein [Polyangiaceae bacterium]